MSSAVNFAFVSMNPARSIARRISGLAMNHDQTAPVRWFSAMSSVTPTSMPITDSATQPVCGLKASAKP